MRKQPQPIIKSLVVGSLASLIMANSASATTIIGPESEYWEEERPTRFEFHVVPIPATPGDADLPKYVPKIQDFVPCRWVVPIIPIMQERVDVLTDSDHHDPIITGYRSGTPQCVPELNEWRRDW